MRVITALLVFLGLAASGRFALAQTSAATPPIPQRTPNRPPSRRELPPSNIWEGCVPKPALAPSSKTVRSRGRAPLCGS
jgi:hypothetical protein